MQRRYAANVNFLLGVPRIICCLHTQPYGGAIAEHLAETDGNIRRNRLLLPKDIIELLTGNAEQVGDFHLGLSRRRDDVFKQSSRVRWAALEWPRYFINGHRIIPQSEPLQ